MIILQLYITKFLFVYFLYFITYLHFFKYIITKYLININLEFSELKTIVTTINYSLISQNTIFIYLFFNICKFIISN